MYSFGKKIWKFELLFPRLCYPLVVAFLPDIFILCV
jgi:hypothetical protein